MSAAMLTAKLIVKSAALLVVMLKGVMAAILTEFSAVILTASAGSTDPSRSVVSVRSPV